MTHWKTTGPLPQVANEHAQLRRALLGIEQILVRRREVRRELRAALVELRDDLALHFRMEERGGCFARVKEAAPRLTSRADAIASQHPALLADVSTLCDHVAPPVEETRDHDEFERAFRSFSERLLAHEESENAMIQEAYVQDIGAAD